MRSLAPVLFARKSVEATANIRSLNLPYVTQLPVLCLRFLTSLLDISNMADEEYECDCGATFETEEELKEHAREEHDADV